MSICALWFQVEYRGKKELKQGNICADSKSVLRDVMKMDVERVKKLIQGSSSLPDGLNQIVRAIAKD